MFPPLPFFASALLAASAGGATAAGAAVADAEAEAEADAEGEAIGEAVTDADDAAMIGRDACAPQCCVIHLCCNTPWRRRQKEGGREDI